MAPDMFSGWGIRTLSSSHPGFNPLAYHNGSVWPHDNGLIAEGRDYVATAWWLTAFPGLAVVLVVLAANRISHAFGQVAP